MDGVAELLFQLIYFGLVLLEGFGKRLRVRIGINLLEHLSFPSFEEIVDELLVAIIEMFHQGRSDRLGLLLCVERASQNFLNSIANEFHLELIELVSIVEVLLVLFLLDKRLEIVDLEHRVELTCQDSDGFDDILRPRRNFFGLVGKLYYLFNDGLKELRVLAHLLNASFLDEVEHLLVGFAWISIDLLHGFIENQERHHFKLLSSVAHDVKSAHEGQERMDLSTGNCPMLAE